MFGPNLIYAVLRLGLGYAVASCLGEMPCSADFIEGYRRVIPVVCIVGKHNSGKTTLLEKLIPCLQQHGRRVAVIKHAAHGFSLDQEGSDSWRLAQTGADAVVLSGPGNAVTYCRLPDDASLPQVLGLLPVMGFDLVLVEGYKGSDYPKIEVHRTALGPDLLLAEEQLAAVVTDSDAAFSIPTCRSDDPQGLVAFLDERYGRPNAERDAIRVTIDGKEVPINAFASAVISGGILGMLSALKGVKEPGAVRIELRRGRERDGV